MAAIPTKKPYQPHELGNECGRHYVPTTSGYMATLIHYGTKWSLVLGDPHIELGINKLAKYLGMTTTRHLLSAFSYMSREGELLMR